MRTRRIAIARRRSSRSRPRRAVASAARRVAGELDLVPGLDRRGPLAPDITSTTVSNDDAANLTFRVAISNRPALTPDMVVLVFLDTDQNTATGDPQSSGADYVIQLMSGAVDLFQLVRLRLPLGGGSVADVRVRREAERRSRSTPRSSATKSGQLRRS